MLAFKNFSAITSISVLFLTSVLAQDDGASGDGGCDPCTAGCTDTARRDLLDLPRMLDNETAPWEEGESMRWIKRETMDEDGGALIAYNLQFDCSKIPEVCNNMCYGVFCGNKNNLWDLTIQRDNTAQCQAARRQNPCGSTNPNYCSAKSNNPSGAPFPTGYSCDEFPFASTAQGQSAGTNIATRCVPKGQNSSQGGTISGFYTNGQGGSGRLPDGTGFTIVLINTGSSNNCGGYGGGTIDCNLDNTPSGQSQR